MSVIALLLSTFHPTSSIPLDITGAENGSVVVLRRELPEALSSSYRSKQTIILNSLATILACTWVAIHPNLPGPCDSTWTKNKRQLLTLFYALLAPEFVTIWAMRQWLAARRIAKELNDVDPRISVPGQPLQSWYMKCCTAVTKRVVQYFQDPDPHAPKTWTITHGFFVQMGGFIAYRDKRPEKVLDSGMLLDMVRDGRIDVSDYPDDDISDKSKGDFFTKLIVVLQTTWFMFQYFACLASNRRLTELEVVALAFAALNIITYALWWKKPQNVGAAIRIPSASGDEAEAEELEKRKEKNGSWFRKRCEYMISNGWDGERTPHEGKHWIDGWLLGVPLAVLSAPLRPLRKMSGETESRSGAMFRVPMFHAENKSRKRDLLPLSAICILFGSLHLIPWYSEFPSDLEQFLWRASAAILTIEPFIMPIVVLTICFFDIRYDYEDSSPTIAGIVVLVLSFLGAILYLFARLTLLALAFVALRDFQDPVVFDDRTIGL